MLNRVVLIGRLTKDVELRYTQGGKAVASFTLAVDRNFRNAQGEKEADFLPVVVWNNLAELCANYLSKGKVAAVDGQIRTRTYDGQDGQKRYVTEILADNVRFLSPKEHTEESNGGSERPYGHEVSLDDDIPF